MFDIVLKNGNLITMNNNNEILYNKDIFIKDGKILAIKGTRNKKNINHMVLNFLIFPTKQKICLKYNFLIIHSRKKLKTFRILFKPLFRFI